MSRLDQLKDMIKKSLPKPSQDCFDGCALYVEEHCMGIRSDCLQGMEQKFQEVKKSVENMDGKLDDINDKIDQIIGNGHNKY